MLKNFWFFDHRALRKIEGFIIQKKYISKKRRSEYLKTHIPIFRRVECSRADWDQNLEKCEEGCVGFWDSYFREKKQEVRCKKSFEH